MKKFQIQKQYRKLPNSKIQSKVLRIMDIRKKNEIFQKICEMVKWRRY